MNMSMYQDILSAGLFKSCCSGWHNYYNVLSVSEAEASKQSVPTIVVDAEGHMMQMS